MTIMERSDGFSRLVSYLGYGVAHGETIERPIDSVPLEHIGQVELVLAMDDPQLRLLDIDATEERLPAICWTYSINDERKVSQDGMLEEFLRLRGAEPDRYRAFARRFGPLMICEHGLPPSHQLPSTLGNLRVAGCRCAHIEPLTMWRAYVEMFAALLTLAASIGTSEERRRLGREELWRQALHWTGRDQVPWWKESVRADKRMLLLTLEYWLGVTGVGPRLRQQDGSLRILLGGGGVLGALALQTTLAAARSKGLAFCSDCHMAYVPKRRPNPNRQNYCPSCRDAGIPNRNAQAAWRARQRAKAKAAKV